MASIGEKRETSRGPRWDVVWYNPDGKQKSYTCSTYDFAKTVKRAAERAREEGRAYLGPKAEAQMEAERRSAADLRTLTVEYLASRRTAGKSAGYINQIDIALALFLATLSDDDTTPLPPERLTLAALTDYYSHLRDRGCSLQTARDRINAVERWWEWCVEQDRWPTLPRARRLETAEPPPRPDPVAPTWEEMDRAIACASGLYRDLMLTCRFTGLRANDQAMLVRRSDIDWTAGTLRIRPELGKTKAERKGRTVPVSPHFLVIAATWPEDPDGWLIHVPPNTGRWKGPPKRTAWNDAASGAWERAGVRPEVWDTQPAEDGSRRNGHPLHGFRAGVITGLQALGVALPDVKYLVGHKLDGGVTTERYTDPTAVRKLREAVDLIPPLSLVEVRAIQGGGVVWAGAQVDGRWTSTRKKSRGGAS